MDTMIYTHPSGKLKILWKPRTCVHSAVCLMTLPKVYNLNERPWLKPENATVEELKAQIDKCPSGALSYVELQEGEDK